MSRIFLLLPLLVALAGCSSAKEKLTVATTPGVQDSGLLDTLGPMFRDQTGIEVVVIVVSSAEAVEMAQAGSVDVVLLHDPEGEDRLMAEGHGKVRREVMSNDFVLVGPPGDPAGVRQEDGLVRIFRRLADRQASFVSRVDEAGTHQRERQLWQRATVEPQGDWYIRGNTGSALRRASQLQAYTLVDRATFLMQKSSLDLDIVYQGDADLVNRYSVITINPDQHSGVHDESARQFAEFLVSARVQTVIGKYGSERYGQPLFLTRPVARPR
jgi:tungstate transport system substrate-binding protein